jgi:S1-C subfamily serine protease
VITGGGAIVTNYHVVDDATKTTLVVMTADGRVSPVQRVLAASRADDLAILKVDADALVPLPVATTTDAAPVTAPIGIISHPAQHFYCYTSGNVSRRTKIRRGSQAVDAIWVTADYARGSSGAPVLNSRGQVVAIVKSTDSVYHSIKDGKPQNLQMVFKICIPSTSLLKLVEPGTDTHKPGS